jgi:hypothetical protein
MAGSDLPGRCALSTFTIPPSCRLQAKAFFEAHPAAMRVTLDTIKRVLKEGTTAAAAAGSTRAGAGAGAAAVPGGSAATADDAEHENVLQAEAFVTG